MSRPLTLVLSGLVVFAGAASARAADEPKDIIARAVKAHGGEDFLAKHKAGQAKNKGKITLPGVGEVDFTQETAHMLPDKFKEAFEMKVGGQTVSVLSLVSGDKMYLEVNGKETEVPEQAKTALKDAGHMLKVARLFPLIREKGLEVSLIGEDKVEGKPVVGVRVSAKGEKDISLYFDKKTDLLTKVELRTADPFTGNEVTQERIITEYEKNKDGIHLPKKVVIKNDGKTFLEVEVQEFVMLEKLDDSEFKK